MSFSSRSLKHQTEVKFLASVPENTTLCFNDDYNVTILGDVEKNAVIIHRGRGTVEILGRISSRANLINKGAGSFKFAGAASATQSSSPAIRKPMVSFFDKPKHQEKHEKHVNFSSQELGATISYSRKKNAGIRESYMTRLPAMKYPISLTHDAVNRASVERPASPTGLNRVHQFSGLQKIPEIPVPIVKLEPIGRIKKTTSANTPRKEPAPEPKSSKCVIM